MFLFPDVIFWVLHDLLILGWGWLEEHGRHCVVACIRASPVTSLGIIATGSMEWKARFISFHNNKNKENVTKVNQELIILLSNQHCNLHLKSSAKCASLAQTLLVYKTKNVAPSRHFCPNVVFMQAVFWYFYTNCQHQEIVFCAKSFKEHYQRNKKTTVQYCVSVVRSYCGTSL